MSDSEEKNRGRPRTFERDDLLTKVGDLFWEHGYHNLSFNEIAQAVGLPRASLYNAFESKEKLFLEAFKLYKSRSPHQLLRELKDGDRVSPGLYQLLDEQCQVLTKFQTRRGCLAMNSVDELITDETQLGEAIRYIFRLESELVVGLMRQAKQQNELPQSADPEATAHMLMTFELGLSAFSKNGMPEKKLRQMCHLFLKNLGFSKLA